MNKVILIGRLTREPAVSYTANTAVARYTLAVDRKYKQDSQQTADFISCIAFGKAAEFAEKYLHQGTKIAVTGRIQTGNYTGKDGKKVYTTDVIIEEHEFCESKASQQSPREPQNSDSDGFMNVPDGVEDAGLPFN